MDTFSGSEAGTNIHRSKESSKGIADVEIIWDYIRGWNDREVSDLTTLVQNIVEARHSDTDDKLTRLCVDSPILDDNVYEWLVEDQLFTDMQLYRKQIEGLESLSTHHEAVRILIQLQAYLKYSPAVSKDMSKIFKRISATVT